MTLLHLSCLWDLIDAPKKKVNIEATAKVCCDIICSLDANLEANE